MAWGPISVGGSVSGYTLPTATASVLGGVKTGSNITNSGGTISITQANVTEALGYTPPTANTWRGIQDNLTSTATDQSLSANQGKVLKGIVDGKAASSHTHDDRYYTESEMNIKLNGKANASHTHDDRYYTESEMNTKLNGKANSSHTHNYAGSSSAGGAANSANKLNKNAGSATQGVYFKDGVPVAMTCTLGKSVPADAKFTDTNTWRGVQDNLTSTATDQSLSANQGKVLKGLVDGKAASSHTHDDRYYTESEMNTKLNGKANSSHTHNYAGSSSAGGTANSVNGLTFAAQTTDPGVGSSLATNKVLIVYQ